MHRSMPQVEKSLMEELLFWSQVTLVAGFLMYMNIDGPWCHRPALVSLAQADMRVIQNAATLSVVLQGPCPKTVEDLVEEGRLSRSARSIDPWNNEYRLWCTPDGEPQVCSAGPDSLAWTTDDVCTSFPEGVQLEEAEDTARQVKLRTVLAAIVEALLLLWLIIARLQRRRVQRALDEAWRKVWRKTWQRGGEASIERLDAMRIRVRLRRIPWSTTRVEARLLVPTLLRIEAWPHRPCFLGGLTELRPPGKSLHVLLANDVGLASAWLDTSIVERLMGSAHYSFVVGPLSSVATRLGAETDPDVLERVLEGVVAFSMDSLRFRDTLNVLAELRGSPRHGVYR